MRQTKRRTTYYDDYPRWLIPSGSDIKGLGGKALSGKRKRGGWFF